MRGRLTMQTGKLPKEEGRVEGGREEREAERMEGGREEREAGPLTSRKELDDHIEAGLLSVLSPVDEVEHDRGLQQGEDGMQDVLGGEVRIADSKADD